MKPVMILAAALAWAPATVNFQHAFAAERLSFICKYASHKTTILHPFNPDARVVNFVGGTETFQIEKNRYLIVQGTRIEDGISNNAFVFYVEKKKNELQRRMIIEIDKNSGPYSVVEFRAVGPEENLEYSDSTMRQGVCHPAK